MDQTSLVTVPRQARWPALIAAVLMLGAALRVFTSPSPISDLGGWLPWLNRPTVTVYFTDSEGRYFVPISRPVSSDEDLPRAALEELVRGPKAGAGLRRTVPPTTEIRRLDVQDGVAYVDFTRALLAGTSAEFIPSKAEGLSTGLDEDDVVRTVTAVGKTLMALPEIEDVRVTVEGQPLEAAGVGSAPTGNTTVTLYFTYQDYLVPIDQPLPGGSNTPRRAMEAYLQGPPSDGSLAGLPSGTELLAFDFDPDNGLAYVNMTYTEDVRALAIAEPEQVRLILTSIIFTLTEFPQIQAVMLDFEGHAQLGLGQCRDLLRTPQVRPAVLNDERTK